MRPMPQEILRSNSDLFLPAAPNLAEWVYQTFFNEESSVYNEEHKHLRHATIGFLWTNVPNTRGGKTILGETEIVNPKGGKWQRERQLFQQRQWFGIEPLDFLITFDANWCFHATDLEFMALVEHELYHCGQKLDEWGTPRFSKETGLPLFAMRSHDVEEFSGIVRRYGLWKDDLREFAAAACGPPSIGQVQIKQICGNCVR